ncbi:ankyrin repeat protein [Metarhizium brunneum]
MVRLQRVAIREWLTVKKKDSDVAIEYVIIFPFENDCRVAGLSFEIEGIPNDDDDDDTKLKERFRTVGLKTIPADVLEELESCYPDESSEPSELVDRLQDVALEDGDYDIISERDGVEEVMTERGSVYLASAACCGSVNEMRRYLEGSPNPTALLQFKDKDGLSLLALAVPNGHRKAVEYLLELGPNVNVTDAKGRTPLMEAALWSHPKIVELLLEAGADSSLKDRRGMTAGNLAEESERNDRERHKRHSKYSEDPFIKKRHRRLIRALLKHTPAMSTSTGMQPDLADLTDAFFYKSLPAATISLVIPRQGIEILTQCKTAAVLVRGGASPPVVAVSGRTNPVHSEFRSPEAGYLRLNEGYWGGVENFAIAEAIGFSFESDRRDKAGVEGSFNASHAEAQLMCFFVRRNYIFRNFEAGQVQYGDDFLQLFMLQERNRQAKIIVSQEPCPSCRALRDRILDRLGIDFSLSECSG